VIAGHGEVIGKYIGLQNLVVLDPISSGYFYNPAPQKPHLQIVLVLACNLAGSAPGTET
jgi:hypothetical protein